MEFRFVVDSMLGKLARWLRILGYSTIYDPKLNDDGLIEKGKEGWILLTSDEELSGRAFRDGVKVIKIEHGDITSQLTQVFKTLNLTPKPEEARCSLCNGLLVEIDIDEAEKKGYNIPPTVQTVWKCVECGHLYWKGSHWDNINRVVREINSRLVRSDS